VKACCWIPAGGFNWVTNVKIYSNTDKVELSLNGVSQGNRDNGTNSVFIWEDVQLKSGENHVEVRAKRGGQQLSDACVWTLKSAQ
jgi:beta-galactosidase